MSKRKGDDEKTTPSVETDEAKSSRTSFHSQERKYVAPMQEISAPGSAQEPSTSQQVSSTQKYVAPPHPPLRVKRPGRPRIHPPKPVGISKPRGRPRGSKNKKPRKRRDTTTKIVERPPKRPRGRPRIWPPEMWEGFQRSQFAAVSQQIQQRIHRHHPQSGEMSGSSQMYYEEPVSEEMLHEGISTPAPPPLSHLPFHIVPQHQQIPQQEQMPLHHPVHHQHQLHSQTQEQMHLIQPLYLPDPEQHRQHEGHMMPTEEQHPYYQEHIPHPPHTTS